MPAESSIDECDCELSAAGWSIDYAAFGEVDASAWFVYGHREDQKILGRGLAEKEAWQAAVMAATSIPVASQRMNVVPAYIEQRIRRPIPSNACVVPGSTPVIAFGESRRATVATLGLNPSRIEFLDVAGRELTGNARRLATHASLGVSDLRNAPSSVVAQVLADCENYFHRRPYMRWFGQLLPILEACDSAYEDGSACHVDLVQWATDPTWAKLEPVSLRRRLIADDSVFLRDQLRNEQIRLLLVNGNGVWAELACSEVKEQEPIVGLGWRDIRIVTGSMDGVRVIAWSANLQSSPGVTNVQREELARRVGALARR